MPSGEPSATCRRNVACTPACGYTNRSGTSAASPDSNAPLRTLRRANGPNGSAWQTAATNLVQALSVGNQQRVQLAVALVHAPQLLILDEPFAGLDPVAVANLQQIIVEQVDAGVAVVFSSHQLELVQDLCEDVSIIAEGRSIADGTVRDLRAASAERVVDIGFDDPDVEWMPDRADVRPIRRAPGRTTFAVPAGTPPGAIVDAAAAIGSLAAISYEPPSLDRVFIELVGVASEAPTESPELR